jgi:microcystin-dependent protein
MKRLFILTVTAMFAMAGNAQVGIGTTTPNTAAKLHVSSESQGVLIPSISSFSEITDNINNLSTGDKENAVGMMVFYQKDSLFYTWDGVKWQCMNPIQTDSINGTIKPKDPYTKFGGPGTVPLGGIIMWSGSPSTKPDGWAICDGRTENGYTTPDLTGKFIRGYYPNNGGYPGDLSIKGTNPADTGGQSSYRLSEANIPEHTHDKGSLRITQSGSHYHSTNAMRHDTERRERLGGKAGFNVEKGTAAVVRANTHYHGNEDFAGETGAFGQVTPTSIPIVPEYYTLAFIMRVQ